MRRKIYSATRSPETSNIYKMCDEMDWNYPTFKNRTKDGYISEENNEKKDLLHI